MMVKKIFCVCFLVILTLSACIDGPRQANRGHLLIVGGREKPDAAVKKFVEMCGDGFILVITSASSVPAKSGPSAVKMLKDAGATDTDWMHIVGQDSTNMDSAVALIRRAKGIFFTGGVQSRLMGRIEGTECEAMIRALYFDKGGIIGGTSAGAAVQSEHMITGDGDFTVLHKENIVTERGLGFLDNCIIDQHFVARRRNNRLLSVVIEKSIPGIGIDESTAIFYHPDNTFDVYGSGSVIVYDPREARSFSTESTTLLSIEQLRVSVLRDGQRFDMKRGRVIQ
ncbi:MAG: cyanophycinase [candidate division KSB1 bacterium]|jgi:cyanophycinase|nr:cyanophycinase [candidate division KSB1 bacterium]